MMLDKLEITSTIFFIYLFLQYDQMVWLLIVVIIHGLVTLIKLFKLNMRSHYGVEYWTDGNSRWFCELTEQRFGTSLKVKQFIKDWYYEKK